MMTGVTRSRRDFSGFTLLELLVAMAIFAIVGALAMGGLNAVVNQRELAVKELERLHQVQRAIRVMTDDFAQLNPRKVRDVLGEGEASLPALETQCEVSVMVCLSRAGWHNPFNFRPRGELQRVQYRFEDGKLIREYWPVMDRSLVTESRSETLLDDVQSIEVSYLDPGTSSDWSTQWPPMQNGQQGSADSLPKAVRISLRLKDWGEISREVEVAG
jgi:general secretion pathway protein J